MKLVDVESALLTGQKYHRKSLGFDQQGGSGYGSMERREWHRSDGSSSSEQLHSVVVELLWGGVVVVNRVGQGGVVNTGDVYGIVELAEAGVGAAELSDDDFAVVVVAGDY